MVLVVLVVMEVRMMVVMAVVVVVVVVVVRGLTVIKRVAKGVMGEGNKRQWWKLRGDHGYGLWIKEGVVAMEVSRIEKCTAPMSKVVRLAMEAELLMLMFVDVDDVFSTTGS